MQSENKKVKFFFLLFSFLIFFPFCSWSENPDSLLLTIQGKSEKDRLALLNETGFLKRRQDPVAAIPLLLEALDLGKKLGNKKELAKTHNILGICYGATGMPDSSLYHYNLSFDYAGALGDSQMMSHLYSNMGNIYRKSGNYSKALDLYFNSVKLCETIGHREGLTSVYNNIGLVYDDLGTYDMALDYYLRSLDIAREVNDSDAIARAYSNIAIVHNERGDPETSLEYDLKSLAINQAMNDKAGEAISLVNIGVYYYDKGDMKTALKYYTGAYGIKIRLNDKKGLANLLSNFSLVYSKMGNKQKAEEALKEALAIATESKLPKLQSDAYLHLSELYEKSDAAKSLMYFKRYSEVKDSLFNAETAKQFSDMERKHTNEKMENEIRLLTKENELNTAEKKKNKLWMIFILCMFILMSAFAIVSLVGYRNKQKANLQIVRQRDQIEEINKEVFSSIRYAKRIQDALLKEENHVSEHLPEHFVLYKPKDIISGDFYWSFERQGFWYLAVADCTGHGVPGAMMSMLGIAFLNEICSGEELLTPAQILDNLREKIIKELSQTGKDGDSKDGMDISLCCFHPGKKKLRWAGANNPLWIIRPEPAETKLTEIKADKQPVGFFHNLKPFTDHEITLAKDDSIYLFSDGYADQFGGHKGKKFKYSQQKSVFIDMQSHPMDAQKQHLSEIFEKWKHGFEQVDDVCIIGVRIG